MKDYIEAELDIIEFEAEDVITASCAPVGCTGDGEDRKSVV